MTELIFITDKANDSLKMLQEIRAVAQHCYVKMMFCETSQFS